MSEFSSQELSREDKMLIALKRLYLGEISEGELLSYLRKDLLKVSQESYAKLVGVSRRTLSDIENNNANLSVKTLNQVFKPFGLKIGLLPRFQEHLDAVMKL